MKIFSLGETLEELNVDALQNIKLITTKQTNETKQTDANTGMESLVDTSVVVLTDSTQVRDALKLTGINYEGDINLKAVEFCRLEAQQECLVGTLSIPRLLDVLNSQFKLMFFINQKHIVIVDDDNFADRIVNRIKQSRTKQGQTRERFLYNFITQFMSRDVDILGRYERRIMEMEEEVMQGKATEIQSNIFPVRKELLTLRSYYDELMDMGKELEENENQFFTKKNLKYFGTIADRADRLMGRTVHLLEYASQVRDAYQEHVAKQQNKNMQFLTVISTIFFPLTLITGWYGMNFQNMPELEYGYPGVMILSAIIILFCIIIFKIKKIF